MKISVLILSIFLLASCTAPFDIQTNDSPPVIVIVGTITNEYKIQEIRISRSAPYFANQHNAPVLGASVTITSSLNEVFAFEESNAVQGLYRSKKTWSAQPGVTYNLTVDVDFDNDGINEIYEAETFIPFAEVLDSVQIKPIKIMGHNNHAVNIYAMDPPDTNFYLFTFFVNDTLATKKVSQYVTTDDKIFNGQYVNGITISYFGDISEWEKDSEERRNESVYVKSGDKIRVRLMSITEGYFNFINQCQREIGGENPIFGGPASNITTNISNSGVGYFTGYCFSESSDVVK